MRLWPTGEDKLEGGEAAPVLARRKRGRAPLAADEDADRIGRQRHRVPQALRRFTGAATLEVGVGSGPTWRFARAAKVVIRANVALEIRADVEA